MMDVPTPSEAALSVMAAEYRQSLPMMAEYLESSADRFDLMLFPGESASLMAIEMLQSSITIPVNHKLLSHEESYKIYRGSVRSSIEDTAEICGEAKNILIVDDFVNRGIKTATFAGIFRQTGKSCHFLYLTSSPRTPDFPNVTILYPRNEMVFTYLFLRSQHKIR